jgi:putative PIN family toxin of toxin-antitoxin system
MGALEVIRVVLDTNVLVSCLLFGGTPGALLVLWTTGRIRMLMSSAMVDELLRVLAYPKFDLSEEDIQYLLYAEVLPYAEMVDVRPGPVIITEDPSDDRFLRCAHAGRVEYIITGDRHLLNLKTYRRITILSPADFLSCVTS